MSQSEESMKVTHVYPEPIEHINGRLVAKATVVLPDSEKHEIFFEVSDRLADSVSDRHDHFALGALFLAMLSGTRMHVHGAISDELAVSLAHYSLVWNTWLPAKYHVVDTTADTVIPYDPERQNLPWISAYSGGLDGALTTWRHATHQVGVRSRPLKASVLVQGFDIKLEDDVAFRQAADIAKQSLESINVELIEIRTNLKLLPTKWEDGFFVYIAACLNLFSRGFGGCLIGSGISYNEKHGAWGSHPSCDPLLATPTFNLRCDGAEYRRIDKVRELANWPEGLANLRFCYSNPGRPSNCGQCEKCLRTYMELDLYGLAEKVNFDTFPSIKSFDYMKPNNHTQILLLEEIRDLAIEKGVRPWWFEPLEVAISKGVIKEGLVKRIRGKVRLRSRLKKALGKKA